MQLDCPQVEESGLLTKLKCKCKSIQLQYNYNYNYNCPQVEESGLLTKLESSGLTLSKIEELGLLSTAEKFGVLSLVADAGTPTLLNVVALVLLGGAAGVVYAVPDDSTGLIAAQVRSWQRQLGFHCR